MGYNHKVIVIVIRKSPPLLFIKCKWGVQKRIRVFPLLGGFQCYDVRTIRIKGCNGWGLLVIGRAHRVYKRWRLNVINFRVYKVLWPQLTPIRF